MKHIYLKTVFGSLCFASLMGLTSCDPLGIEPTTKVDEAHFWENGQLARAYVNNFYLWSESATGENSSTFQSEQWSDNCQGNAQGDWNTIWQQSFNQRKYDSENSPREFTIPWTSAYKNVRAVNLALQNIPGSADIKEDTKNQLLGECHFFRAFIYFDMEKYWGTVPYVDKALTVEDDTFLPQVTREELFDNILGDLEKSVEYFEAYTGNTERGMINKDVANAYMSRVALYAANAAEASAKGLHKSELFKFTKDASHYYDIAWNAAQAVIKTNKYDLESSYETLFTSTDAHTSVESIWPVMFNLKDRSGFNPTAYNGPNGSYYGNTAEASHSWGIRKGVFPTQDLVDCYLQKDEADGKYKNWWETKQAQDMGVTRGADGEIKGESADYRKMYENRDERFYATVTYDGAYMGPEDNEKYIIQTWIDNSDPKQEDSFKYSALHTGYRNTMKMEAPTNYSSEQTITGYYNRKYSQFNTWNDNGTLNTEQRTTCYFNIRYAEVLLNAAEAAIKANKEGAVGYINQIRERAGIGIYEESVVGHNLWEELKIQRRLEFAFECPGHRYFDLLRWNEAEGNSTIKELNTYSRGIHIFRKGIESMMAGENGYPVEPGGEGYFTPYFTTADMEYSYYERRFDNARYYFMPIPGTRLSSYTQLKQNPGWEGHRYTDNN